MKFLYILLFASLFCITNSWSQKKQPNNYIIEYKIFNNDSQINSDNPIVLITNEQESFLTSIKEFEKKSDFFPSEEFYINYKSKQLYLISQLNSQEKASALDTLNWNTKAFTITPQTKFIQGYNCKKATITINSTNYEFWFTKEISGQGSPITLGSNLGVVLEMTRNKTYKISASKISKDVLFNFDDHINLKSTTLYDKPTFQQKIWLSRFITIPIFKDETIAF